MPEQVNIEHKSQSIIRQNNYAPIILWLFPLLLINLGWYFINYIDTRYENKIKQEQLQLEVEDLASNSDFSNSFSKLAYSFYCDLKSGIDTFVGEQNNNKLIEYLSKRADRIFRKPFPEHELYTFHLTDNRKKSKIIYKNSESVKNKRALEIAFQYLIRVKEEDKNYTESERKNAAVITKSVFGGECDPQVIAETQCGKASYAFYKLKSNRFIWDYYIKFNKITSQEEIFGYFLIVDNEDGIETSSKLLALRDLRDTQTNKTEKKFGAFVPLFPGYGGIVASEEFKKKPEFKTFLHKLCPKNSKELYDIHINNSLNNTEVFKVGKYTVLFYVAPNQSHATVLFVPDNEEQGFPQWLIFLNIFVLVIVMTLLLRGFLLGIWLEMSLKIRFFITYFLAASIPIGLLIIVGQAYITEYYHISLSNLITQIRLKVSLFDSQKVQKQDDYRKIYQEIKKDSILIENFKKLYLTDIDDNKLLLERANDIFGRISSLMNNRINELPVISFCIVDECKNQFTYLATDSYVYHRKKDKDIRLSDSEESLSVHSVKNKSLIDRFMKNLSQPYHDLLEKKIKNASASLKIDKEKNEIDNLGNYYNNIAKMGYKMANGNGEVNFEEELEKRLGFTNTRVVEDKKISSIQDFIYIDKIPRFMFIMVWDNSELDEKTFKKSKDELNFQHYVGESLDKKYNFNIVPYKKVSTKIEIWGDKLLQRDIEFDSILPNLAKRAFNRESFITYNDKEISAISIPSEEYKDLAIVGYFKNNIFKKEIAIRYGILFLILTFVFFIFLVSIKYSYIIFIKPISNLKNSLDKVAEGNYDLKIKTKSKDEFGLLCNEFGDMIKELSERNKLATLISDHAVEALSKKSESDDNSDVETFKGTVLVTDIRNFTGMCEIYSPNQITSLLNEHFANMTKIFSKNGGRIYKYIGDAVEVIFAEQDDSTRSSVERAFTASVEMLNTLNIINQQRKDEGLFEYKIGIGLCYGSMVSGSIGSLNTRLDYAILGDTIKKAEKLESFSKFNVEFPIVVDKEFTVCFKKFFPLIDFTLLKSDDNLDGYKITDSGLNAFLSEKKEEIKKINQTNLDNKPLDEKQEYQQDTLCEIEDNISFLHKFIVGSSFIILLITTLIFGLYLYGNYANKNKKVFIDVENQRVLNQIKQEDYGKVAFDKESRVLALKLNNLIDSTEHKKLTDSLIADSIKNWVEKDVSIQNTSFKYSFIKIDKSFNNINFNDISFVDKINTLPVANYGFNNDELKTICDSFKAFVAYNKLDEISNKNKLNDEEKEKYKSQYNNYIEEKYLQASNNLFGKKLFIKNHITNTTIEANLRNENNFIYILDYYKESELLGYFIIAMPVKETFNSILLNLNTFSNNNIILMLKNEENNNWFFSENTPKYIIKNIRNLNRKENKIQTDKEIKEFIKSVGCGVYNSSLSFNNQNFILYILQLNEKYNFKFILITVFITIFLLSLFTVLWKISLGKSFVNKSISAQLWIALLIVAVVPIISMSFVSIFFLESYYNIRVEQERANINNLRDSFERKIEFGNPLVWNFIKKNTDSNEIINYINSINSIKDKKDEAKQFDDITAKLRKLIKSWVDERNNFTDEEKIITNFRVTDISISGKNNWEFIYSQKDNKDKINSLNNNEDLISMLLVRISNSLLYRRGGQKESSKSIKDGVALEKGLQVIRTFFGSDLFVKLSHAINIPIVLNNVGEAKMGLYISPLPNYENAEAIIVWMISFNVADYILNLSKNIKTEYSIYSSDSLKYGDISITKDNNLRIPLGEYGAWLSTSKIPISSKLNIGKESYLIEGIRSSSQNNSIFLFTYPEKNIKKEINKFLLAFSIIMFITIMIIIDTTKSIANDIINPVEALINGIKEVNKENFSYRINSERNDELGSLCLAFDKMINGLEQKRLISRMISKTAKTVTLQGSSFAGKSNSVMLYIGIPNFSLNMFGVSENVIFDNLKKQTDIIAGLIMEKSGEVDKIMGERMLAVFPVVDNEKQTIMRAYSVAKTIMEKEKNSELFFPVAIGLNYGNVINGFLGVGNKRDFTVIGDAVNVTARIEGLAESLDNNRCLVSEDFYKVVSEEIEVKEFGKVELKGKSEPMRIYQLN